MIYRANITRYLIILALVTIACAVWGYCSFYGEPFLDALYKAFQLFNLGGDTSEPETHVIINVARFIAPCVTILGGVQLIYSFSRNGWRQLCLSRYNDHIIVCGYGFTGKRIADSITSHNKKVIVIDPNIEEPVVSFNELHISKDATDMEILTEARIKRASEIIIATGDDYINAKIYRQVLKLKPERGFKKAIRIEKLEDSELLKSSTDEEFEGFNFSELITNSFPLLKNRNIIILGLGSIGKRLIDKYQENNRILVFEQSSNAVNMAKDKYSEGPDLIYKATDVNGLTQENLENTISKSGFKHTDDPVEVFICLGGDWMGFSIAWRWMTWANIKMKLNLIGTDIEKELFENISTQKFVNEIAIYNIVDDTLKKY